MPPPMPTTPARKPSTPPATGSSHLPRRGALPSRCQRGCAALRDVNCDLLVTIGGALVSDHDVVKPACRDLGLEMIVEGVAVRPGKPSWFGLPGNPVSAMVCAELFAAPILAAMEGAVPGVMSRQATLAAALPANGPREHFMRATFHYDARGVIAEAAPDQDSSLVSILAGAGGLIRRLTHAPAAAAGDTVDILSLDRA